jgi:hypothetical protein
MRARTIVPLSTGLALAVLAAALVSGAACERACKPGTLFLDVDLGSSRGADTLQVDVTVAGGTTKHTTRTLSGGPTTGTLEIDFPSGYPDGKRVDLEMTATKSGATLGTIAVSVTLASSCTHATIVFPGGGGSGAGGHGGSSATTGAGGSSATTGAGGSSATTGAGGSSSGTGGSSSGTGGSSSGTGGTTGTGGTSPGVVPLIPDTTTGYVQNAALGVMGPWYAFSDGVGLDGTTASGDCELKGGNPYTACSQVITPGTTGFPPSDAINYKMCTSGTVAKVIVDPGSGTLDYSNIWGAGIGLDFNHIAGDSARGVYSAPAHNVVGVSFNIDQVPAGGVRVTFPTMNTVTTPPIWMANAVANYTSPLKVGYNEVRWAQVMSPGYATNPPAFDQTLLLGINFHVPTTTTASQSYSFCISNLSFILGP